jgi:hypothetical protein
VKTIRTLPEIGLLMWSGDAAVARKCRTQAMSLTISTLEEKAAECAREARKQAALLAPGPVRDALLQKAKAYEAEIPEGETYE